MLKKMRRRFIGAAMAAFSAVIVILLCAVNLWNWHSVVGQLDQTIDMLQSPAPGGALRPFSPDKPPADPLDQFSPEVQYMIRFFAVECDADGQVQAVDQDFIASVTQQTAEEYTAAVLEKGKTRGFYQGYRYAVDRQADGITLLFLNAEREVHSLVTLLLTTGLIAAVCLLAVLVLVTAFSRRAIAPYLRNLETQKQFITNAGHELKTPLTAIITSADVLSMEQTDNEWVQGIRQQAGRMGKLITQLVALSRLDEENPFPDKAVFSLSDAVWETAEPFASMAAARGLTYTQEIADAVQIYGDRTAVQQMVSILLDNAVRYADEHGQIALSLCRRGRKAELTVSNTCRQAEEIDTARLFDRFYRADESHSGRVAGTGIGLSIARATAEAHSGAISARRDGENMVFRVELPAAD